MVCNDRTSRINGQPSETESISNTMSSKWRAVTFSTIAAFVMIFLTDSGISLAQDPERDRQSSDSKNPADPARKPRRKAEGRGQAKKKGQEDSKARTRQGPEHRFEIEPPVRDYDIILGRPTDSSVTVSVMAQKPIEIYLRYSIAGKTEQLETSRKSLQPNEPAEWILAELAPDQEYEYELLVKQDDAADFEMRSVHTFRTARKHGSAFAFAIQADSHLDQATRAEVYMQSLEKIRSEKPDFFVDLGDTFMTDKFPQHRDALPQYLAQRYFLGQVARSSPLFFVLGNHDGERGDRFDGTTESMPGWSNTLRKKLFPNPEPDRFYSGNEIVNPTLGRLQNYYAWTWGDALLIALDPFWPTHERGRGDAGTDANWARTLGDDQYRWLKSTLETSKAKYKFVFIHHLVGGLDRSARGGAEAAQLYEWGGKSADGTDEFAKRRPNWAMPIHDLLVKHKVSAVFHGHDHFYARQELDGIAYVLVPQPGHSGGGNAERSAEQYGYETGVMKSSPGHMLVSVQPEAVTVEFVPTEVPRNGNRQQAPTKSGDKFTIAPK
ncbi:metallophosphoesterase [bacterium]|nr:metallophosphoesterase [bacterium]